MREEVRDARRMKRLEAQLARDRAQLDGQKQVAKVGDIVVPTDTAETWYGKLARITSYYRTLAQRTEWMYVCRKYDSATGLIQLCPDSRCAGHTDREAGTIHCPICSRNLWSDGFKLIPPNDLRFYIQEGMIRDVQEDDPRLTQG